LKDENTPVCVLCNSLLTLELFHNIYPERVASFAHAIGLADNLVAIVAISCHYLHA